MQVADILSIQAVVNVASVDTVMGSFWQVHAFRGPDSDEAIIDQLATDLWASIDQALSDTAVFSCIKMVNLTTPAKVVRFPNLAGLDPDDSHPPHQVVSIDSYARDGGTGPAYRNTLRLSGVREGLSTRGRVNDSGPFQPFVNFLTDRYIGGANGADLDPLVRRTTALGGPGLSDTYTYHDVEYSALRDTLRTLRSRRFRLCV